MQKPIEHAIVKPRIIPEDTVTDLTITELSCPIELDAPVSPAKVAGKNALMPGSKRQSEDEGNTAKTFTPASGATSSIASSNTGVNARLHSTLTIKTVKQDKSTGGSTMPTIGDRRKPSKISTLGKLPGNCSLCVNPDLGRIAYQNLYNKYERATQNTYNINVINDLIINSNTHITAVFKDYLIYDDIAEVLKGWYFKAESYQKIAQLTKYYEKSSKVFPNYIAIDEKKYLFKNIERKQKMINAKCIPVNKDNGNEIHTIITKGLIDGKNDKVPPPKILAKMNMADLVEKFIDRDSLSLINHSNCTNVELPFNVCDEKADKKSVITKQRPKVLQLNNFVLPTQSKGKVSPALRPTTRPRHQSQEPIKKHPQVATNKKGTATNNGRISAAGYYRTYQGREEPKKHPVNKMDLGEEGKAKLIPVKSVACVSINLNLDQHQIMARSITPQTCSAANKTKPGSKPQPITETTGNMTSKPVTASFKTLPPRPETLKGAPKHTNIIGAKVTLKANVKPGQLLSNNSSRGNTNAVFKKKPPKPLSTRPIVATKPPITRVLSPQPNNSIKSPFPASRRMVVNPTRTTKTRAGSALAIHSRKEMGVLSTNAKK